MLKIIKPVSLILLTGALCTATNVHAVASSEPRTTEITQQKAKLTGVVEDALGPITGASVLVKGTTNGNITDIEGNFTLEDVSKGATIVVSFVGYIPQEIKYTGQPSLKVMLVEDTQQLGEVVVMGYGGVQKAKTLTAAATVVKVDQIAKLPVTTIGEGLGGRVTGVVTQQSSGAPGENTKIWIRGGSKILYVIDDVVMETAQGEVFFNRMRPDDIASMTILKDASATAVYGPRANDGVVVIQTKRGQNGAPEITFNQKVSIMTPSYRPKGMTPYEYAQARNEVAFANFQENPTFNNEQMAKYYMGHLNQQGRNRTDIARLVNEKYGYNYTESQINGFFDPYISQGDNIEDYYQNNDPWDMFNHTQPMYQTNMSIRGGGERVNYYSSLGYLNQKGISDSFGYEQINVILNTDAYLLNDKSLKFTLNVNGSTATKNKPAEGEKVFNSAMYGNWMPTRPAQWSTGKRRAGSVESLLNTGFDNTSDYRLQLNAGLKWNLPWVQGLAVEAKVNYNTSYNMNKKFSHNEEEVYGNPVATEFNTYNKDAANLYQGWANYRLTTGILQADYARSFGKHNLAAMVNYQSQVRNRNWTDAQMKGYPTTFVPQLGHGEKWDYTKGSEENWGSASYIGRVSYDYDSKYMIQYSANYNGSLSYSPAKRWGFFQAVSAGWMVSEEAFFKGFVNSDILNMFKIRGGYGIVGGEIGAPFDFMNQYAQTQDGDKNIYRILLGDNMASNSAWSEYKVASDLTWSKSRQISGGIDFEMFKGRLSGSLDTYLYMNHGDKMNMNVELIRTDILGMPNIPQINAPFETNRKGGIEFSLNWQDKIGEVGYRVGVNYSYWDQRVTRHPTKSTTWYYNVKDNIGMRNMHPVYTTGLVSHGLYGAWSELYSSVLYGGHGGDANIAPGSFRVEDLNHDGRIDIGSGADQKRLNFPGTTPLTQYGVTLGADWRGFDIELFFQGATNVSGAMPSPFRSSEAYMWNYGQYGYLNSYLPSNPNLDAPLPIPAGTGFGYTYVDAWAFDASYLKLKNISVRYDMKRYLLKRTSVIKGLDLSFVVTNAFTWTKKSYPLKGLQDPEFITSGGNIYSAGGVLGSYPTQRSYTLGVTVTL